MNTSKKIIAALLLTTGCLPARIHAQWFNDVVSTNKGVTVSDWSLQATNTATGTYSTAGSTGAPSDYGLFEHRGQSGNGAAAALVNNGSYDATTFGRDYFMGPAGVAGQQEISGAAMPAFGELFIQNGAASVFDISNSNGIRVANSVSFANGITTTVRANTSTGAIKLDDNATYSNSALGDAQHVDGYVSKTGNDAFTFPVGSGTDVRTLGISAPASASDQYSVAWIAGSPNTVGDPSNSNAMHPVTQVSGTLSFVDSGGQWDWIPVSGTGSGLTVTVSLPAGITLPATFLRLAGWNGSNWIDLSGAPTASGNTEGSTLSGTMVPGIQAIAVGGFTPDLTPTLDIDALSFSSSTPPRDFVINLYEIKGAAANNPISFRIVKLSAFTITYPTTSGTSNVFGSTANENSNWTFAENTNFITVTAKPGVSIPANGQAVIGFTIARKPGISTGTIQNISTVIVAGSGNETNNSNNGVITSVSAN